MVEGIEHECQGSRPRALRAAAGCVSVALAAGLLAACGNSGTSASAESASTGGATSTASAADSEGVRRAQASLDAAKTPPKFVAPGPGFDASKARGKTVYFIANALSIPFTASYVKGAREGLESAGVKLVTVDMKGDVSEAARLVSQAVAARADLIVTQKPEAELIKAPLEEAKAAGIPVVSTEQANPRELPQELKDLGVTAEVNYDWTRGGELLADYVIADSNGTGKGLTYWSEANVDSRLIKQGQDSEFAKNCPGCDMTFKDVPQDQWADRLPTQMRSDLNKDYVYYTPSFDGMLTFMTPAIKAADAWDRVKVASFNSDLPQMKQLKNGEIGLLVGSPVEWLGWAVADQSLRILTGHAPVADEHVPLRVFDHSNIGSVDLTKPEASWYGTDFAGEYKKLWGLG